MSHKATLKMKIDNKNNLIQALDVMGIEYQIADIENGLKIESRYDVEANVDVKLTADATGKSMKAVGFRKEQDGSYVAEGDFYELGQAKSKEGESLSNENTFKSAISKRYAYVSAMNALSEAGYVMTEEPDNLSYNEIEFTMESSY